MKKKIPTPSLMDSHSTLESSPFSHYSTRNSSYTERNNSSSQLQASFFFSHTQRDGTEVSVIAPGSLHDPHYHGKLSCPRYLLVLTCKSQDPTTLPPRAQPRACQIISCICSVLRIYIHIFLQKVCPSLYLSVSSVGKIGNLSNTPNGALIFQTFHSPMVKSQTRLSRTILLMASTPSVLYLHGGVILVLFPGEKQIRRWSLQ